MPPKKPEDSISRAFDTLRRGREAFNLQLNLREVGAIANVYNGIARVTGLPGAGYEELLKFPNELYGIAFNLDEKEVGVVLLGEHWHLHAGDKVERTRRVMDVPVGEELIGRVINPLGQTLDQKGQLDFSHRLPIQRQAPAILDRAPVNTPLQTGVKTIDALIPVGRGQRELILGDRQTGKTAIAVDTIINQHDQNVLCIYCSIGQRASSVAKVIADLTDKGAMDYTIVVVTEGNDPAGLTYIAPYAATSIGEYFAEKGRDVLIVYDDLTQHARAYREISLLLRRPPGREAFPGDIFYIHSRLLERATHLREDLGGGSITALPIIETEAQNISAYIPTNLISITDGQIYLSPTLFERGVLPAIDIGKSVSRVGGEAQLAVYRSATGGLKLEHAQFEELENFARFGTRLDEKTRETLEHGKRIRAALKQPRLQPVPLPEQILVLLALKNHLFDEVPLDQMEAAETDIRKLAEELSDQVSKAFFEDEKLSDEQEQTIISLCKEALETYASSPDKNQKNERHAGDPQT